MSARQADPPRTPFAVPQESFVYLHAVSPLDSAGSRAGPPFLLEETGIDGRTLCFAWDSEGLRFFFSLLPSETANLGRGGVLLLSRQDSIRLRGVHESVLNDLRLHGILLPFPFGTVVTGWQEVQRRLRTTARKFSDALVKLRATQTWNVAVFVLDSRFADLQKHDTLEKRRDLDRHRISYASPSAGRRIDVSALERMLGRQRRLAESVHATFLPVVDKGSVRSMVSMESGISDDWKCILKASYDVRPTMLNRFFRLVTDLQYQHILLEPMISLTGDVTQAPL